MSSEYESIPPRGLVPAGVTAANIGLGFGSMLEAAGGRYSPAVYMLLGAILLDMFDGRLARKLGATSVFGKQLDSFCDVLSFGAAPAFLIYVALLRDIGMFGLAAALLYLFGAVFRLARFNLLADPHAKARRTLGVPVPIGASYLMALTLLRAEIPAPWAALVVVVFAGLLVSRWRLPDLRGNSPVTLMLLVGMVNYIAFVAWPNWITVAWWNVWNLAILAAAKREDRRLALESVP